MAARAFSSDLAVSRVVLFRFSCRRFSGVEALRWSIISIVFGLGVVLSGTLQSKPAFSQQTFRDCPECPEMVAIPSGSFVMGAAAGEVTREFVPEAIAQREVPAHIVFITQPLAVGVYEVTRDQYAAFVAATGRDDGETCFSRDAKGARADIKGATWRVPGIDQTGSHPVVCLDYSDAAGYVEWLSETTGYAYRLPSESEWEYAARAGTVTTWFWGDNREEACGYANVPNTPALAAGTAQPGRTFDCDDGYSDTAPTGSFRPNGFGLHDMIGNVWEWVEDCWHPSYVGAPQDGTAWVEEVDCNTRVVRGGGWSESQTAPRAAARSADPVGYRGIGLGFRVARDLK